MKEKAHSTLRQTPLWRRSAEGLVLCNACGVYEKLHKTVRPTRLAARHQQLQSGKTFASKAKDPRSCQNCKCTETTLWRKMDGLHYCNSCGLFYRLHGHHRPSSMAQPDSQIKRRVRRKKNSLGTAEAQRARSPQLVPTDQTQYPPTSCLLSNSENPPMNSASVRTYTETPCFMPSKPVSRPGRDPFSSSNLFEETLESFGLPDEVALDREIQEYINTHTASMPICYDEEPLSRNLTPSQDITDTNLLTTPIVPVDLMRSVSPTFDFDHIINSSQTISHGPSHSSVLPDPNTAAHKLRHDLLSSFLTPDIVIDDST